ncbi:gamma-glutamyl-gamma-aminobutyrate hydrolase family protein [Paenibacillus nanensis]|uniref:Gamma-glutamyl-gamma-aminobutyrate hydrolase family protein n=1 Tax=Paenibacillus nanensis TaxID=393251 RepID=A0A3A1V033_9BACL|nr:gamma-glutamyl-gamma-aminobutyrate hydrolase family protein [Paenibacillus nanensis]RIX53865.1 gamma-glutamyl-gamma-aminobutyrate hydrolase family protein [Paenibacillus nanensis]
MKRPTIGVLPLYDGDKQSYWMLPGYMKGIEEAGGIPFMLPLTSNADVISEMAAMFDGFLFTGGHDVNPELYGEEAADVCGDICSERDVMESVLFRRVVELDKPAFGICRGIQLFNVLLGGSLYQDLPTQFVSDIQVQHKQSPPYSEPSHSIYIEKGNPLYRIVEKETLKVNSYHHQGIKKLSERLIAVAKAEDGLIEAVTMRDKTFVFAVQWHPEFSYKSDPSNFQLFEAFVKFCGK